KTRVQTRLSGKLEDVADGVWLLRGGFPGKTMNVYFMRDGNGVLAFDAGVRSLSRAIAREAVGLGGLTRVVLGHGDIDHRGAASAPPTRSTCGPGSRARRAYRAALPTRSRGGRGRRCGSSPASSPARRGPAPPTRSPATCPRTSSGRPTRRSGQAVAAKGGGGG